jgi:hypothetical protein
LAGKPAYTLTSAIKAKATDVSNVKGSSNYSVHANAVWWLYSQKYTTGKSATKFGVEQKLTRGAFASFLYKVNNRPAFAPTVSFKDISSSPSSKYFTQHAKAIWWLASINVAVGYTNGTYRVNGNTTRASMSTFIKKYWNYKNAQF